MLKKLLFCVVTTTNIFGQDIKLDFTKIYALPQEYVVHRTVEPLIIDGKATEEVWAKVPFTAAFVDIAFGEKPQFDTRVKMLWDEQYLYIYARLEEPHVWGNLTEHDAVIFYNNDFEVFIDPTDDTYDYTEIEINALNTVWDLKLNKPYRMGGGAENAYEIVGLKTAVYVEGTLNDASDIDSFWSVEMAIPIEVILKAKHKALKTVEEGDYWRVNFSRVQWECSIDNGVYYRKKVDGKFLPEYNWVWNVQEAINMHLPERWGYIQFTKRTADYLTLFERIEDQHSKRVAYNLMDRILFGDAKELLKNKTGVQKKINQFSYYGELFDCTFMKTFLGFEILVENKTTKRSFVINEEGVFRKI